MLSTEIEYFLHSVSFLNSVPFFKYISYPVFIQPSIHIFLLCYKKNFQKLSKFIFKNNTPYISKQPLMMAYESTRDNFGKFLYQFQPKTKTLIRKLEMILNELYWQNLSLLFNETYIYILWCGIKYLSHSGSLFFAHVKTGQPGIWSLAK